MDNLSRVLFIGVDAGDKDLVLEWVEAGLLPNIASLLDRSAWTVTQSPVGLFVGAIWPSFYTAVSPGKHGRYCYQQLQPGSYDVRRVSPREVCAEPFWNVLSSFGKRVAVIDVPKTFPAELPNGLHIVDWGSHDPDPEGFSAWPESLEDEIRDRFGVDNMHSCNAFRTTAEEFNRFRDELIRRVERKAELDSYFLDQGGWDCFITVFSETHCIGHQCWHLHDSKHHKHDPGLVAATGDPMLAVYQAIDAAIGKLVAKVGDDADIVLFSSHGFASHYDATFLLDDILYRLDGEQPARLKKGLAAAIKPLWKMIPYPVRQLAAPLRRRARRRLDLDKVVPTAEQQAQRQFFSIPNNDTWGGVRINLAGREPEGKVAPGDEYEALCSSLSEDLMAFVNCGTGEPLVKRVLRSRDCYEGEKLSLMPDLLVEWNRSGPVTEVASEKTGVIRGEYRKCRTGDHRPDGLLMFSGPSITPGRMSQAVSVMDIAPTVAAMLGVELAGVDGKPIVGMGAVVDMNGYASRAGN